MGKSSICIAEMLRGNLGRWYAAIQGTPGEEAILTGEALIGHQGEEISATVFKCQLFELLKGDVKLFFGTFLQSLLYYCQNSKNGSLGNHYFQTNSAFPCLDGQM